MTDKLIFSDLLNRHYELDFEQSNPRSFHKAVWLIIVCHQTEFGCKGITSAGDIVETIIWPHTVTLILKIAKHFYMTLAHNDTFAYYIWPQKVKSFRRYHPGKQSITFWTFAVTLTLTFNTANHICHKTLGDSFMMLYHSTKFGY